jgi:hypothetical protein
MFCQLDGKARDTTGSTLDQDRLARLQFQWVFDRADRRQPGKRQRSGIDMRQAVGFLCDDGCLDRNLLGIGALLANVADGEDLIADTEVSDTFLNRRRSLTPLYGPAACCKRFSSSWRLAVLHQSIRPLIGAFAPGHHGYQHACVLISGQASTGHRGHQCSHAPGRPILHLFLFLSQTSAGNC